MSILIKGMEMPTYEKGVRTINVYADGVVTNYAEVTIGEAVPVPPHGELIEKHDVFRLISAFPEIDKLLPVQFMQALYNLPTVIPAEPPKEKT